MKKVISRRHFLRGLGAMLALPALEIMSRLAPDAYLTYLDSYYREGLKRFGSDWGYADTMRCNK